MFDYFYLWFTLHLFYVFYKISIINCIFFQGARGVDLLSRNINNIVGNLWQRQETDLTTPNTNTSTSSNGNMVSTFASLSLYKSRWLVTNIFIITYFDSLYHFSQKYFRIIMYQEKSILFVIMRKPPMNWNFIKVRS